MKKMILLFSHKLTEEQELDARESLDVEEFEVLDDDLQKLWSNVPSDLESVDDYLEPVREYLRDNVASGDIVLIQGDFGATFAMVSFVNSLGAVAVYATTKRDVVEREIDGKIVKTSVFEHVRFRAY